MMAIVDPVNADDAKQIYDVQQKLLDLGYTGGGPPDGILGLKTQGAILNFRNRNGLPLKPGIDDALVSTLATSPKLELPIGQVTATAPDIAPKVAAVAQTRWAKFWAKLAAFPSIIIAASMAVIDKFGDAADKLAPVKTFFPDLPTWVYLGGFGGVAIILAIYLGRTENAMVEGYQKGTVRNDLNQSQ